MPTTIPTVTSSTRPGSPSAGDAYFETDTKKYIISDGANWRVYASDTVTGWSGLNRFTASFDGSNDYLEVSSGLTISGSSTVSLWFRRTGSVSGYGGTLIATKPIYQSGFDNTFAISLKNGTDLTLESYNSTSGTYTNPVAAGVVSTNTWYHLALVLTYTDSSTSSGQFYLNGNTVGSAIALSGRTLAGLNNGFSIGAYFFNNSYSYNFPGKIDDVAILDTALDQTAITALYNSGVPDDVTGAAGWWRMGDGVENGSGTTIYDMSVNNNNGVLINGASIASIGSGEDIYA